MPASLPPPHTSQPILSPHRLSPRRWSSPFILHPSLRPPSCRPSSSTLPPQTTVVEEGSVPQYDVVAAASQSGTDNPETNIPSGGCKTCGREEMEKGCNGEGRIQGGIATVPGFGWWPIKAYRPCPGFVASGGRYRRRGQSMDEVASGGRRPEAAVVTTSEVQSTKGRPDSSKFKR